jgi:hypothetical protein
MLEEYRWVVIWTSLLLKSRGESSGTLFSYHFERTQVGVVYFSVIKRALLDYQKHPFLNQIVLGDCRTLSLAIPNESIDCIFTDPPYEKKFLPLYTWLAKEAARILKPYGFLLTYAGSAWKYEVMLSLGERLTYFWDYIALDAGAGTIVWNRKTLARHKSILAFVKGEGKPRCNTLGVWTGTGADKKYHVWGQDESTARYYIDCFTQPGAIVYDPFCGGEALCRLSVNRLDAHLLPLTVIRNQ